MGGGLPSNVTSAAVSFLFVSGSDGWSAARRCLLPSAGKMTTKKKQPSPF